MGSGALGDLGAVLDWALVGVIKRGTRRHDDLVLILKHASAYAAPARALSADGKVENTLSFRIIISMGHSECCL